MFACPFRLCLLNWYTAQTHNGAVFQLRLNFNCNVFVKPPGEEKLKLKNIIYLFMSVSYSVSYKQEMTVSTLLLPGCYLPGLRKQS